MYIPSITNYKPFYVQTSSDTTAKNTLTEWGLVAKTNPYPLLPTPKEPYKNDWKDENGEDEYNAEMHYKPVEFEVSFYIKTKTEGSVSSEVALRNQLRAFFDKIKNGEFMTYDSYTGVGFRNVRYEGFSSEDFKRGKDWSRLIVKIKFKANDPVTKIGFSSNKIVVQ